MRAAFDKANRVINSWVTPEANASSVFKRCHVSSIVFDQRFGREAKSVNRRLHKVGFVVMMTPNQFLTLTDCVAKSDGTVAEHIQALHRGRAFASPYLHVNFDHPLPRVTAHKGHCRMNAILASERYGDIPVPVIIRPDPRGNTGLFQITDKDLANLRGPVFTEKGRIVSPTGMERIYINGERKDINDLLRKKQMLLEPTR